MPLQIEVTTYYRSALTNEQLIAPGTYNIDDPALFGQVDVLVATGKGVLFEVEVVDEDNNIDKSPLHTLESLSKLSISELRDLANKLEVTPANSTKRQDIIDAIIGA